MKKDSSNNKNENNSSKRYSKKVASMLLFSAGLAATTSVGVSEVNVPNTNNGVDAHAAVIEGIDWDKVGDVSGISSTARNDFTNQTNTGTSSINDEGYAALTQGSPNTYGYLTSKYKMDFKHDFSFTGNAKFGSQKNGILNNNKAGDAFNFLFSSTRPGDSFPGMKPDGGFLGMNGLANAFGLVFDEHYNDNQLYGDFRNQLLGPGQINVPSEVVSWRTTSPEGNLNSNERVPQWGIVDAAGSKDPNAQVVSMNTDLMDGKEHTYRVDYNAETSVLTVTVDDNAYGPSLSHPYPQNIYKNTGAFSGSQWTRQITGADKANGGMYLTLAGVSGDTATNDFGARVREYHYNSIEKTKDYANNLIDNLPNLTNSQKNDYKDKVNNQTTSDGVGQVYSDAKKQSDKQAVDLTQAKKDAKNTIDKLENLTPAQKTAFEKDVDNANTKEAIDQVVSNAIAQDAINKANKDTQALQDAKDKAKDAIDDMTDLTDQQKDDYKKAIDEATSGSEIQNVIDQANAQNEINKANNDKGNQDALNDAKDAGKKAIDSMPYLSQDQKNAYKKGVDAATDADGVKAVVDQANAQNEINKANQNPTDTSLQKAKDAAKKAVDSLTHLSQAAKDNYKDLIAKSADVPEVNEHLNDAYLEDMYQATKDGDAKALQALKDQAIQGIKDMSYLTAAGKQNAINNVNAATDRDGVSQAFGEANTLNNQNRQNLEKAKANAKDIVNGLTDLTDAQKDAYNGMIDASTSQPEIDSAVAKARAQDAVNKASKNPTSDTLRQAKDSAKEAINALPYLSDAEKAKFNDAVESATTTAGIADALNQANAQNAINKAKQDSSASALNDAKQNAKNAIDSMQGLTPSQKADYKSQVDAADTPEEVADAFKAAQDQAAKNQEGLAQAKKDAINTINDLKDLTQTQKDAFQKQVQAANTTDEVANVVKQAQAQDAVNKAGKDASQLNNAKNAAKEFINTLPNLSADEKAQFIADVNNAKTAPEVQNAIDQAKAQDTINKAKNDATALQDAKNAAKDAVDSMSNLTDAQKDAYKKGIDAATNGAGVQAVLDQAKAQDAINKSNADANSSQALTDAKNSAKKAVDSMENLTQAQKDAYKNQIDAAKDGKEVQAILNDAKTQDAVNKANNSTGDEQAKALQDAKNAAKDTVDSLTHLTNDEKKDFNQKIDDAKDANSVMSVVTDAKAQDSINEKTLAKNKQDAKNTIDSLAYLTDQQKTDAKNAIDSATNQSQIDSVVKTATTQNEINKYNSDNSSTTLKNIKDKAKDAVNSMNLTDEQKAAYEKQIDNAKSVSEVQDVLSDAKSQSSTNDAKTDSSKLNEAKEDAKNAVENMSSLTDAQKKDYQNQINNAKNANDVQNIVDQARVQDAINKAVNTNNQANFDNAKNTAKNAVDNMTTLTDKEKQDYKDRIDEAKTTDDIQNIINEATQKDLSNKYNNNTSDNNILDQLKDITKKIIDQMTSLTDAQKEAYKKAIDSATNTDTLDKITTDANNQNTTNKENVDKSKSDSQSQIDRMDSLTQEQKEYYKKLIENSTTTEEINRIINEATTQNKINESKNDSTNTQKLNDAKNSAKNSVSDMSDLTDQQKKDYQNRIDNAKSAEEVQQIIDEARTQNAVNNAKNNSTSSEAFKNAQDTATNVVNGLDSLTKEQRDEYNKRIADAKSADEISNIVKDAVNQNAINKSTNNTSSTEYLNNAKSTANNVVDTLSNLSSSEKSDYKNRINNAKTAEEVQSIINEAKTTDALNALKKENTEETLNNAKNTAKNSVDDMNYLTDQQKKDYKDRLDKATNASDIENIMKEANQTNNSVKNELTNTKTDAKKTVNNLSDLTTEQKNDFNSRIDNAKSKEEVQSIIDQAQAQNAINKAKNDQTSTTLTEAKNSAKNAVNNMSSLSQTEKDNFNKLIDSATTAEQVEDALSQARAQNDINKSKNDSRALQDAKNSAKNAVDGLDYLSQTEKDNFKKQIDNASDTAGVQNALDQANTQNAVNKANQASDADKAKALQDAKDEANKAIDNLANLSNAEKEAAKNKVNSATNANDVQSALNDAKALDAINKATNDKSAQALQDAKNAANDAIDKLAYLTPAQKDAAKKEVNAATDAAGVKDALTKAQDANNTGKQALDQQKTNAKNTISGLNDLTPEQKTNYINQIDAATNKAQIDSTVANAQAQNDLNAAAKDPQNPDSLAKAKTAANNAIDAMTGLSATEKSDFKAQVNKQTSVDGVITVLNNARLQDAINRAKTDSSALPDVKDAGKDVVDTTPGFTDGDKDNIKKDIDNAKTPDEVQKIIDDAKALGDAKTDGKKTVDGLDNLTPDQKNEYKNRIDNASTPDAVQKIVDEAKKESSTPTDLTAAKKTAKETIDNLANLSNAQKDAYKQSVDASTSQAQIDAAVAAAKAQDAIEAANKDNGKLPAAKTAAKDAIDKLVNLSSDQKAAYKKAVDAATDADGVENALKQAQAQDAINKENSDKQNAEALQKAKNAGRDAIDAMPYLTDAQKKAYKDALDNAKTPDDVATVVNEAAARDAINKANADQDAASLAAAKDAATKAINALPNLTDAHKADFVNKVKDAKTSGDVQAILIQAIAQDALDKKDPSADDLAKAKESAKNAIDAMPYLTQTDKDAAKKAVDDAKDAAGVTTALENAAAKNEANKNGSALTDAKTKGKADIAELGNLTQDQRDAYNKLIDAATTPAQIDSIVANAKAQDAVEAQKKNPSSDNLKKAKDAVVDAINKLTGLSADEKAKFGKQANDATNIDGVLQALSDARLQDALNRAGKGDSSALNDAKDAGKDAIDANPNLTPDQKEDIKKDIDNAKTPEEVDQIVKDAQDFNKTKQEAKDTIDGLDNLTNSQKQGYKDRIDKAKTPSDVKAIVDEATKANDDAQATTLDEIKKDAKNTINNLKNLSDAEKQTYLDRVDAATTKADVNKAVADAKTADANKGQADLAAAKKDAKDTVNALTDLSDAEKKAFNDKIDAATDKDQVNQVVTQAQAQDAANKADNDASQLQAAKDAGKKAIDAMPYLSTAEKDAYKTAIDSAKDGKDVASIVKNATAINDANKAAQDATDAALKTAKDSAKDAVNGLKSLSDSQKEDFLKQIDDASTPKEVAAIAKQAQAQDALEYAKQNASDKEALQKAKDDAKAAIDAMPNLTKKDKDDAKTAVDQSQTVNDVKTALDNAKQKNDDNAKTLDTAKKDATDKVDNLTNLSTDEKNAFKDKINKATSTDQIDSIVANATAQDSANASKKDPTDTSKLDKAKEDAKKAVDAMPNLTDKQKTDFKADIDSAKDAAEVQNIVDQAKVQDAANRGTSDPDATNDAKEAGKDVVDNTPGLTDNDKKDINDKINDAKTPDEVNKIVEEAKELGKDKTDGKETVNNTDGLTDQDKKDINSKIDDAKTSDEVKEIIKEAQDLGESKVKGKDTIDDLNNLTPSQKQEYKDRIDNAKTADEVQSILTEATNANGGSGNQGGNTTGNGTVSGGSSLVSVVPGGSSDTNSGSGSNTGNTGNETKPDAAVGEVVYATNKIYLYENPTFNKSQRLAGYSKKPRINRPMFVVTGTDKSKNGVLRYKVRDVNHKSATAGKTGYITANDKYVVPVYYKSVPSNKTITVIAAKGANGYRTSGLTGKIKNYKQGTVLKIKGVEKRGMAYRYILNDGSYITANKKLVAVGKLVQPVTIKTKKGIKLYKDVNLSKVKSNIKKGKTLKVKYYAYSRENSNTTHGTKRYAVAGGFVTGNSKFVSITKTAN
ncbi:DUF5776 domain-containing protein [Lentilactobacillus sp. Marseille-Q4993]|uniref:DUF5776 domain-containing protein n=1 Tax=Lentilactobacillus sp. Marseille-Q4993 TaxID=3039492 RepID=UPI0024BC3AD3|nr:DUF5776 domain-containing protein [Lentilactobacillus sp. Marseille-Q4993]